MEWTRGWYASIVVVCLALAVVVQTGTTEAGARMRASMLQPSPSPSDGAAPVACFDITRRTGLLLEVDATCSSESETGEALSSYRWDWGDGREGDGATAAHTYSSCPRAQAVVTLTVSDVLGGTDEVSADVTLEDFDHDEDGLFACRERAQLTSDKRRDDDGDGLSDLVESEWWRLRDEVFCGRVCDFPDPIERDIYVEIDWMASGGRPYRFSSNMVDSFVSSFSAHGISLHVDQGSLGGGNRIAFEASTSFDTSTSDDADRYYNDVEGDGFARVRRGVFHYVLSVHGLSGDPGCSVAGLGEIPQRNPRKFGDLVVIFRNCLGGRSISVDAALAHVFMQELGHNLFGPIEPAEDRWQCPGSSVTDRYHDRFYGYAMWPLLGGGGSTYHPNRWNNDMNDMGEGIVEKLGSRARVNKLFELGHDLCS